jgi:predicted Zn-dependent protease
MADESLESGDTAQPSMPHDGRDQSSERGYTIFPTTWKARLLLAIAFLGGLVLLVGAIGANLFAYDFTAPNLSPEPLCPGSGPQVSPCLNAHTGLQVIARDSCDGSGKRVCIAPLGDVSPALVQHLVGYYQDTYGLSVVVLRPAAIPRQMVDPLRQQVDAATLIEYMGSLSPEAYADPNVVFIGLTSADLYDKSSHFRYVFGLKGTPTDPKAVVSTSRMDPKTYGLPADDALLFSRARKLVTKYIGLLFYGLEPSADPRSPLYDDILAPGDLDDMGEPLPVATPGSPGATLPLVSSFHYVETAETTIGGESTTDQLEAYYQAPDSVRVLSDSESPFLETVLIGSRAWTRDARGWSMRDADSVRALAFANITVILELRNHQGFEDAGAGPTVAGGPTRRYRLVVADPGERIRQITERLAGSSPECAALLSPVKDLFDDTEATVDMVLGERTNLVYSVVYTFTGPQVSGRTEFSIDQYNVPVQIKPPSEAQVLPERTRVQNPCHT